MIHINNKKVDLMFQVEQDVSLTKILNGLTINDNVVMIICPSVFFSNVIGDLYDYLLDDSSIHGDVMSKEFVELKINYKKKEFELIFLITPSESKVLNLPMSGDKLFNIGFKKVQL